MSGIPLGLALGVPLGTFLGEVFDWRAVFVAIALVGAAVAAVAARMLHTVAKESGSAGVPWKALRLPGLDIVLVGAGAFQLGHVTV